MSRSARSRRTGFSSARPVVFLASILFPSILLLAPFEAAPARAEEAGPPRFLLVLEATEYDASWSAVERLAELGCRELGVHGEGVIEGIAGDGAFRAAASLPGVRLALRGPADERAMARADAAQRDRLELWNFGLEQDAAAERAKAAGEPPKLSASLDGGACALLPPVAISRDADPGAIPSGATEKSGVLTRARPELPRLAKYNNAWGAADYQTSEYLLGRIVVAIVTPQTPTGAIWSRDQLLAAHEAVRTAMGFWRAQGTQWSDAPVYLSFEYLDSLRTTFSPLTSSEDTRWVPGLMASARARLGIGAPPKAGKIPDQSFTEVYQILNFLRSKHHADWAIMTVVGLGDRFTEAPGLGAYAFLGGPYLVTPNAPINWSLRDLVSHESGHLFFALDEYEAGRGTSSPCTAVSGYLRIPNKNSRNRAFGGCAPTTTSCTMDRPQLKACVYTEGMMGILDSDGDAIRDILDTQALVELVTRDGSALRDSIGRVVSDTVWTLTPVYVGLAREAPAPNRVVTVGVGAGADGGEPGAALLGDRPPISMNTLERVEYRIDSGNWTYVRPDSSGYDAPVEDFQLTPEGLSGGAHVIEFRAQNSAGNVTEPRATTKERVVVMAVKLDALSVSTERGGGFTIRWNVKGAAWGSEGVLYRSENGGEEIALGRIAQRDNSSFSFVDPNVRPGRNYEYRVETAAFGKTYSVAATATASVPISNASDRLSYASPNPFNGQTSLSFIVPDGVLTPRPPRDPGHKPGPPPELPTKAAIDLVRMPVWVKVTIHDVTGREVRRLVDEPFAGASIYTANWDGKNAQGEPLPAGVYFSRFEAGNVVDSGKIVIVR